MADASRIWAVVPVKSLPGAKRRLAPLLDADERHLLARAMVEDVLDACRGASLSGVLVVTGDEEVAAIARRAGARVLDEACERGTNAAVAAGLHALAGHASGAIVVPADLPHVSAGALDAVAGLCARRGTLVLVPASRDGGTNLFAASPPNLIEPSFGPGSFARHRERAEQSGIAPVLPVLDRLDLDLDRPEDVEAFLKLSPSTRTHRVLLDLAVPARLGCALAPARAAAAPLAMQW